MSTRYKVVFEIEVVENSHFKAAEAVETMLREDDYGFTYIVQNTDTEEIMSVDLSEPHYDDAVIPLDVYEPLIVTNPVYSEKNLLKIENIKRIIREYGSTTSTELELPSSPCIKTMGNGKQNVSQLAEGFNEKSITAVTYHDENVIDEEEILYEFLPKDTLDEIEGILEDYEAEQEKTFKRIQS